MKGPQPLRARHRLGQNFLSDPGILDRIVEAADLSLEDHVLEIGPGLGALTERLVDRAGKVTAVELDERMQPALSVLETTRPGFRVIWGDFMKLPWETLEVPRDVKVVANIPYYITTPILLRILQAEELARQPFTAIRPLASRIVMMVQDEVADRLTATPGSKAYGSLSVICQYATEPVRVVDVPRGCFTPAPKVDSAVVLLVPRSTPPVAASDPRTLFRVVRGAFGQRRKTLRNALLAASFEAASLARAEARTGIDLGRRGETLSLAEFALLANALVPEPTAG